MQNRLGVSRTVMRDIKRGIFILRDTYDPDTWEAVHDTRRKCVLPTHVTRCNIPLLCVASLMAAVLEKILGNLYCNTVIESTLAIRFRGDWKMWREQLQISFFSSIFTIFNSLEPSLFGVFIIKEKKKKSKLNRR